MSQCPWMTRPWANHTEQSAPKMAHWADAVVEPSELGAPSIRSVSQASMRSDSTYTTTGPGVRIAMPRGCFPEWFDDGPLRCKSLPPLPDAHDEPYAGESKETTPRQHGARSAKRQGAASKDRKEATEPRSAGEDPRSSRGPKGPAAKGRRDRQHSSASLVKLVKSPSVKPAHTAVVASPPPLTFSLSSGSSSQRSRRSRHSLKGSVRGRTLFAVPYTPYEEKVYELDSEDEANLAEYDRIAEAMGTFTLDSEEEAGAEEKREGGEDGLEGVARRARDLKDRSAREQVRLQGVRRERAELQRRFEELTKCREGYLRNKVPRQH